MLLTNLKHKWTIQSKMNLMESSLVKLYLLTLVKQHGTIKNGLNYWIMLTSTLHFHWKL